MEGEGFQRPDLEGIRRGLRRPRHRLPGSEPRWPRRRRRRNSTLTGRALRPAEIAAAISSRPGPWAPCATRVMRTEVEAAGQPLEPGQYLSKGEPRGGLRPRAGQGLAACDLGSSAASAQPGASSGS